MVNNFEHIKSLLRFEDENEFYFVQIIQRKKEHANLGRNNRLIKPYFIFSIEQFDKYSLEIFKLCNEFNARAYIHLNRRNAKVVAFEMMELLATNLKLNQFNQLSKLYTTVCGNHHSDKDKTWIVDIDIDKSNPFEMDKIGIIADTINESCLPKGNKLLALIETKNGYHLITKPFNSKTFGEIHPEIELHRNNPTILFYP
jgi:hypothetical protein